MKVEDLKWYSPFVLLVGAILSFADPITDILTLVEFYRADHKTWFGVGLAFIILPCLLFPVLYSLARRQALSRYSDIKKCTQTILCGFHPFSAAFARLQGFVFCINKWCRGNKPESADNQAADELLRHIGFAVLFESLLESAPQFIIQLYAASVQEEPVDVIQMISLPVSFLSLAWAFTTADEMIHKGEGAVDALRVIHQIALFITHLFLLSSRLFAVCYFTVSYKWWIIFLLLFHTFLIVTADTISYCPKGKYKLVAGCASVFFSCVHWLRDDLSLQYTIDPSLANSKSLLKKMQLFSNVLFVSENCVMILLFYFSQHSDTWYALPVTVCVCLFSVLGSVMRVTLFHILLKDQSDGAEKPQVNNNIDSPSEKLCWMSNV